MPAMKAARKAPQAMSTTATTGGKPFSVHAAGERVYMVQQDGERREVDLTGSPAPTDPPPLPDPVAVQGIVSSAMVDPNEGERAPGTSPLDDPGGGAHPSAGGEA